jgi:hypothetical protein
MDAKLLMGSTFKEKQGLVRTTAGRSWVWFAFMWHHNALLGSTR